MIDFNKAQKKGIVNTIQQGTNLGSLGVAMLAAAQRVSA
jgi:hypothetical protein